MPKPLILTPVLLLLIACGSGGVASGAVSQNTDAGVKPTPTVPENSPITDIRNIPATAGKANRAETAPPFTIETIGDFDEPFAMAFLPDGGLLVTEKAGHLKLRDPDGRVQEVAGAPTVAVGGQGGLLDVALAPDFADSGTIYLTYSEPGSGGSQLALGRGTLASHGGSGQGPRLNNFTVLWRSGETGPGGQFGANILFAPDGKSL